MIYKNLEFHNVEDLIEEKDGFKISRFPLKLREKVNEGAKSRALMPAGCELRFNLLSEEAKFIFKNEREGYEPTEGICEIYLGDFFYSFKVITDLPTEINITKNIPQMKYLIELKEKYNLPFDPQLFRIILPYRTILKVMDIKGEFAPPENPQIPQKRILFYGSSITHGATAIRPTGTYAFKTAQLLNFDLINLGVGGAAHFEKEVADYIYEREDWDYAFFEIGINMVGGFSVEEFKERVEYFLEKISQKNKIIFCTDLYIYYSDFFPEYSLSPRTSEKTKKFREIVKNAVKKLKNEKVIYINSKRILKSIKGLTSDIIHPSPFGMEEMAYNISKIIKTYL